MHIDAYIVVHRHVYLVVLL